ncbi:MAG: hypothetical protein RIE06_30885 [Roseibium album]
MTNAIAARATRLNETVKTDLIFLFGKAVSKTLENMNNWHSNA